VDKNASHFRAVAPSLVTMDNGVEFNSRSLSVRAQKKILGKMASRNVAKHFITDNAARLLDGIYRILKDFYSKKEAEKVVKNVIKMVIKLSVLIKNEQFNAEETRLVNQFQQKFRFLAMTFVSFYQVEFTYDRLYLTKLMDECQSIIQTLIKPHLSEKSTQRVQMVFHYLGRAEFLDFLFRRDSRCRAQMDSVCQDLNQLLESGEL